MYLQNVHSDGGKLPHANWQGIDPGTWVDDHGHALYRYALARVRRPEIAEDLVQETFLAALGAKDRFQSRSSERTRLTGILKHKILDYYRARGIHLVASLPCYLPSNVDRQRGCHVYQDSVVAIQRLNEAGYGQDDDKVLDLVYNPGGPSLPPDQYALASAYSDALGREFNIAFNALYTITNMPIGRFLEDLVRAGEAEHYQQLLRNAFNPDTLDGLMCRHQLHVGWDGTLYDCDFNFALGLPATGEPHIGDFAPDEFLQRGIATADHCFACTAGCGSSCGGALT